MYLERSRFYRLLFFCIDEQKRCCSRKKLLKVLKLLDFKRSIDFYKRKLTLITCFLQKNDTAFVQMEERLVTGKTILANGIYVAYTEVKKPRCRTVFYSIYRM